eukprot:CAMPEP_0172546590 /NCGR_PEP_ID=MMETSP1067-20121228/16320_1 /TAXON_ID=265564 ORGANISM="Thalassiosira punctigera, Strain Tpunct2005C2" /NCGR_SAMPLE_ID=MMETSP1067 /ASSEMBLY_ACC=CAM_ASM_000444 /LENGTH=1109 /DNA_ID=CAMNT_0013333551 /DNA_START=71 /DNA_END=3400 /DNA_ORIENTATION=-
MGKLKQKFKGATGYHDDSDSVSELSHDESSIHSNTSKSDAFRAKFGNFGKKKKGSDGTASVGSGSRKTYQGHNSRGEASRIGAGLAVTNDKRNTARTSNRSFRGSAASDDTGSTATAKTSRSKKVDEKRLIKDAKSRFNIGLVYLKTGDYAKAQENLEHSLFCHIQVSGHDAKAYTNDAIFAIAGVREKLGDCYVANTAIADKYLAVDHYEESRRLLKSVDPEDAPDNLTEMLQRVEEKLKQPDLRNAAPPKKRPPAHKSNKYQMQGNEKAKKMLGVGVNGGVGAAAATATIPYDRRQKKTIIGELEKIDVLGIGTGIGKGFGVIHEIAHEVADGIHEVAENIKDIIDDSSDEDSIPKTRRLRDAEKFEAAIAHLERDNHRTALNHLISLQEGGSMTSEDFRHQMADSMLKVATSAFEAGKISIATDAYEKAYAVLTHDKDPGDNMKIALRGCIKCHKLLAMETEGIRAYGSAISHRSRVCQLLEEDNRTVPACEQQVKIAHLHGIKEEYAKSAVALSEAIRRLYRGVKSVDNMANDRRDLLIQCHLMQAVFYSKSKKWNEALEQYDEALPLIAKKEGQGSKQYNSASIHKSALLVTIGSHCLAAPIINQYLKLAEFSDPDLIVDDLDHALALDTSAATNLKAGNVDKAIFIFERKLEFVKTLPNNDEMKSDTLHKLGCLHANKNQPKMALPLLNQALSTKKFVFDGKHRSVLETTWAVAATNHTLGDNDKALKEYSVLLEKMSHVKDMPVDSVIIHNSAGKLFFEDGKVDKAIHSFRQALQGADTSNNLQLKSEITLNLANALSTRGEADKAMELYGNLLSTKSLKKTKISYLTRFNKSLLLIKMGEVEKAKGILQKIVDTRSSVANDVRGNIYLTLGNLAVSDGNIDEGLGYFEKSFDVVDDDDLSARAEAKRSMAMAQLGAGQTDKAILILEDVLEDILNSGGKEKAVNILSAEIWNSLARVYKKKGDLPQVKNFSKLALQEYKAELGETNPITLRNVANLQLILLEEAEDLEKSEAKSVIDAAKFELEETLEAFVSLDDPWTYRLDVASLKTNLGFIAIWQGKPKKAKKLVRQIKEIELPPEHTLVRQIMVLEERIEELEMKKKK